MDTQKNTQNLSGKKILYVEDDQLLSNLMLSKLKSCGASVQNAKTAGEALEILKTETFDCVLLDLLLPDMSGFEVLKNIKNDDKTSAIPVVVFSNLGEDSDLKKASKLGAEKFVVKSSVVPDDVPVILNEILSEGGPLEEK